MLANPSEAKGIGHKERKEHKANRDYGYALFVIFVAGMTKPADAGELALSLLPGKLDE